MSVAAMAWAWGQDVPTSEKFVLVCLADHADHAGVCWPGQDRVAEKTGLSERTVRRAVQSLIDRGLLVGERRRRDDGKLAGYTYTLPIDHRPQRPVVVEPPATVSATTGHSVRQPPATVAGQEPSVEPSKRTTQSAGADGARAEVIEMSMVEPTRLARLLSDCARASRGVLPRSPQFKPTKRGVEAIEKLHRIDGVAYEEIAAFIRWLYESDSERAAFWRGNILSGDKLRKQFFRVRDEAAREQQQDGGLLAFLSPEGRDQMRRGG